MATEDVIELGSSDDDAEPAPKKVKNIPTNAMVHIPTELPELTIKPTKRKGAPVRLAGKSMQSKMAARASAITMTKVENTSTQRKPSATAPVKVNGRPLQKLTGPVVLPMSPLKLVRNPLRPAVPLLNKNTTTIPGNRLRVNSPMTIMNKFNNTQLSINKVPVSTNPKNLRCPIKVHDPRSLNKLPPDITIVKTVSCKRPMPSNASLVRKKQKQNTGSASATLETVELDDDDLNQASTSSPQWYLRPEEQSEMNDSNEPENSLEDKNNAEPECSSKMIEITIEDSPIKVIQNKRTHEVGAELAITIDDSPIKAVNEKDPSGSDCEQTESDNTKTPRSKKKLNYPKETEATSEVASIEIEIEPMEYSKPTNNVITQSKCSMNDDSVVEIFESPAKPVQDQQSSTPKKDESKRPEIKSKHVESLAQTSEDGEFHPIYQNFIDLCLKLENSDDMKKIVDKKIKAYYKQVPQEYTLSEDFIDMVSSKIISMQASPEKMYLYIKDIVDELNLQRKMAKAQPDTKEAKNTASEKFQFPEDSEFDAKRQRQIRKLEKTIKKLHRAIQKLEEQEVDFDDEEDSVYLFTESDEDGSFNKDVDKPLVKDCNVLLQRYKERMIRVHAKFCQLTNTKLPSEPRLVIEARPGQPTGPAKRLEKWVNRKVPIGTPLPFPDFHDVLRCVRDANEEDKLGWNEADIMEEARDLFTRCGKKLQRRRQENEWRLAVSRISVDIDPAEHNAELLKKLSENKQIAAKKETELFNKFADRQCQLKLEPEEIGDKEAEESPVDDEEEEETNEESCSLQDKEKRKEKIKQLLQIKKKKSVEEKKNELKENESRENESRQNESRENESNENESKENESKEKESKENELTESEPKETGRKGENKRRIEEFGYENESQIKETTKEGFVDGQLKENEKYDALANYDDTEIDKEQSKPIERVHTISDDSSKVESDVDELNLLQKLHSESEMYTSAIESTDTGTPIDISDSLSSSDNTKKNITDVISIENSSYSESELKKDIDDNYVKEILPKDNNNVEHDTLPTISTAIELGDLNVVSDVQVQKYIPQTSNDEYNDPIGNILLASSEDELADKNGNDSENEETSVNLQDDALSIGDTVVQEVAFKNAGYTQSQCSETNINNGTEQFALEDNNTVSSCGDDLVVEKQRKHDGDAIGDTIDIFSSFDKNSEESGTSVKSADQVVEDDNEIFQKEYCQEKSKVIDVTEIISDSNGVEVVNVRQPSENVMQEDVEMIESDENIVNKAKEDSELTAVAPSNKEEIKTDNAGSVIAEPMEIVESDVVLKDTTEVDTSNIASNNPVSDSVLTKDDARVSDIERSEDSLDALLEELHSDLNSNK